MRVLLDTHAFLWWIGDDRRLSVAARAVVADGDNEVFFSTASAWEMAIKARLGRLWVAEDFQGFVADQVALNGFRVLSVELLHALHVQALPDHHRDPFDRLLVAQSRVEGLALVTADGGLSAYGVERIW